MATLGPKELKLFAYLAFRVCGSRSHRHYDDVRQAIALAAVELLPNWDPSRGTLQTYAGSGLLSAGYRELTRLTRELPMDPSELPEDAYPADPYEPEAVIDGRRALEAVQTLEPHERQLLYLRHTRGRTLRAAAEVLGVDHTTAWRWERAALQKCREAAASNVTADDPACDSLSTAVQE